MISPSGKCFFVVLCNRFNDLFHVVFGTTPIDHPNVRIDCKYGVAKWWSFQGNTLRYKSLYWSYTIQLFSTSEFHHFLGMTPLFPHTAAAAQHIWTKYYTSVEYRTQKNTNFELADLDRIINFLKICFWQRWNSDGPRTRLPNTMKSLKMDQTAYHLSSNLEIFQRVHPNTSYTYSSSSRYPCTLKELTLSKQWFTTANCL